MKKTVLPGFAAKALLRTVAVLFVMAGCLVGGASSAHAQVYMGDEPPTQPGVYFMGYQDIYGNIEPTQAGLEGPATHEIYLSIGSSAGDYVAIRSTSGAGWSIFDFDHEAEVWLFGGWDWMDIPLYEVAER